MPHIQSTEDFLSSIDPALTQYSGLLITKGFSNTRLLAHLTFQDVLELPIGHRRLLINEVTKIRSPHSKSLLTALDVQNIQSDGSAAGINLQPKQLFPKTPAKPKDPLIESYTYMTPMQKHLNTLQGDIEIKEQEMEKIKLEIDSIYQTNNDDDHDTRPHCSICHEIGHRRNRCSGQKCPASVSCGKLKLHKDELKHLDTLKANLKKIVKDKMSLDAESEKINETINQNNRSFAQAVRGHLINSNKHKYLTTYADQVVPLTKVINIDLSILQKHYNNRVPANLQEESDFFQGILDIHQDKISSKTSSTSLTSKLKESVRKWDLRTNPQTGPEQPSPAPPLMSLPPTDTFNPDHRHKDRVPLQPLPPYQRDSLTMPPFVQFDITRPPPPVPTPPVPTPPVPPFILSPPYLSQPQPKMNDPFYSEVLNLSRHFDDLHSPPKKIQKMDDNRGCTDFQRPFDPSSAHIVKHNPFYSLPQPQKYNPPCFDFPPWHKPIGPSNSGNNFPNLEHGTGVRCTPTAAVGSGNIPHTVDVAPGTGNSPPLPGPIDYSIVYDQFNLKKPKTALANRYSSENIENTKLNEPDLD